MPTVHLQDRALISIEGPDAAGFLQGVVTPDLDALTDGEVRPGALLSPQGKILFDFLISRGGPDRFLLDCRVTLADDLVRRLMLYRLRAKVTIAKQDQAVVAISWPSDSTAERSAVAGEEPSVLRDTRFPASTGVLRRYAEPLPPATEEAAGWHALRIGHGVAESGPDYAAGDAFPHDVLLDENGGVGFGKGCYIGQEVVSRMQHRGTARRRIMIASGALPAPGTEIVSEGRPVGVLGTVVGGSGLALVRIDKVKEALDAGRPLTCGNAAISLAIPPNARYRFPETAPADGAGA